MKRIDVIKKEICDYVQGLSVERLYIVLSVLEDYRNETEFPVLENRFTCEKCIEIFSECPEEDIERGECIKRFSEYAERMADYDV